MPISAARFPGRHSLPPFVKRKLVHVYQGRFCFRMPGVRCGTDETTWSRTMGQEEEMTLAPSAYGFSVGSFRRKHVHEETFAYKIGRGASTTPVWCFEDSELHEYEASSYLGGNLLRRRTRLFLPAEPGFFCPNHLNPDPECQGGGHRAAAEQGGEIVQRIPGSAPARATQVVEPVGFSRAMEAEGGDDPGAIAAAAAQILAEDLTPAIDMEPGEREDWYEPGLVHLGGAVTWLGEGGRSDGATSLVPASAGCLARDRHQLLLNPDERGRPFPVLAFAGDTGAERAEVTVVAEGAEGSGELWSEDAVAREDGFELPGVPGRTVLTTVWGQADLSWLPDGVGGSIVAHAFDSDENVVARLELPFTTEERAELVPALAREVAETI